MLLFLFSPIKHSERGCQNLIINEDFSHSGPLITMATPSAANGHTANMLFKRTASHTAVEQMALPYLYSIMMLKIKKCPKQTFALLCIYGAALKKIKKIENKLQRLKEKSYLKANC